MKPELQDLLLAAKTPQAISEVLYQYCASMEGIRRIEFLCNRGTPEWGITCFIATSSQEQAHILANHLNANLFGDKSVFLEVPLPGDFVCAHYCQEERQIPQACKCNW